MYLSKSLLKFPGNRGGFVQKVVWELQAHPIIFVNVLFISYILTNLV